MIDLYAELRTIVHCLESAEVPSALAGRPAVSIDAPLRATEDVARRLGREPLARAAGGLESLGFRRAESRTYVRAWSRRSTFGCSRNRRPDFLQNALSGPRIAACWRARRRSLSNRL